MEKQENLFEKLDYVKEGQKEIINKLNENSQKQGAAIDSGNPEDEAVVVDFIKRAEIEMVWQGGSTNELKRQKKKFIINRVIFNAVLLLPVVFCIITSLYGLIGFGIFLLYSIINVLDIIEITKLKRYVPLREYRKCRLIKIDNDDNGLPERIKVKSRLAFAIAVPVILGVLLLILSGLTQYTVFYFVSLVITYMDLLFGIISSTSPTVNNYHLVFVDDKNRITYSQLIETIRRNNIIINQ